MLDYTGIPEEERERILKEFKESLVASDENKALLNNNADSLQEAFERSLKIPRRSAQMELKNVPIGEIVTLSDGTKYEVTTSGWRKI